MPIRLNLLAEAKAAEEMRRRDPVKRAVWIGAGLVAVVLIWSATLYAQTLVRKSDLTRLEESLNQRAGDYKHVQENQRQLGVVLQHLASLHQLATNRHLNGNVLQALQQAVVDDIQITRLKTEQTYTLTEGSKVRTNDNGSVTPAKPATASERITLLIDAKDSSANPGDQIIRYKQKLAAVPYFQEVLGRTNEIILRNPSAPQIDPETSGAFVLFTLECRYPEKVR